MWQIIQQLSLLLISSAIIKTGFTKLFIILRKNITGTLINK